MIEEVLDTSKIIFVGGAPRSGTTLVQRILASHPDIYGGPEFDLIPEVVNLRNAFHAAIESGRLSKYLSHQETDELFAKFVTQAFSYKLQKMVGKTFISEKTPANVTVFSELAEMLPDSHLVFVLRDPRAVVASMLQVGERYRKEGKQGPFFTRNVRGAVEYINFCWAAGSEVIQRHGSVHVVYYEDVVTRSEETVSKLVAGLGLSFESSMVEMNAYDMPEFKIGEEYWYSKEKLLAPISSDSVDSWRRQLSGYQNYYICKRIRKIAVIDRYDLSVDESLQLRIVWILYELGWGMRSLAVKVLRRIGGFLYRGLA